MDPYSASSSVSSSPSSSPRHKRFDFLPPPRQTFEQAFGSGRTFLDGFNAEYKAAAIKYFNEEATPTDNAEEFLNTLQAVLETTAPIESKSERAVESDPVKEVVRKKFIDLYWDNTELQTREEDHAVHNMLPKVQMYEETPFTPYSYQRPDPMLAEIDGYLTEEGSELIDGYLAVQDATSPLDQPDQFYDLYKAILQNCPKAPALASPMSSTMSPVEDPRATLRSEFDRIYKENCERLEKRWNEKSYDMRAAEIRQLRSAPFPASFGSPPAAMMNQWDQGELQSGIPLLPQRPIQLQGPQETFNNLQRRLGPFDFNRHGLDDISMRISAFYNAEATVGPRLGEGEFNSSSAIPIPYPLSQIDLATVIKKVLTQLKPPSSHVEETIDFVVRQRFIEIFHFAAQVGSKQGGLSIHQTTDINRLVDPLEQATLLPSSWVHSSSSASFSSTSGVKRKGGTPPSGGGNPLVKGALLLLALYLGYRFVAQPAYQWIRKNNTTPVGE